jgi:hypothetical protein
MDWVNLLLNLAGLLLWLNWWALSFAPRLRPAHTSLFWALKETAPYRARSWRFLAGLVGLLCVRSYLYWQVGSALNWTATVDAGAVAFPFRSDHLGRMFFFSWFSFGLLLFGFYVWLLLLAAVNRSVLDGDPWQQMARVHLGKISRWPLAVKLLLPALSGTLFWATALLGLIRTGIASRPDSRAHFWEQAAVLGLNSYLSWRLLITFVLALYLVNSYIYLGYSSFWGFINVTARNLLYPLRRWRVRWAKVDFVPLIGIGLVSLLAELAAYGLQALFRSLPL